MLSQTLVHPSAPSKAPPSSLPLEGNGLEEELRKRMNAPQRYRLLQGYPMPPLMPLQPAELDPFRAVRVDVQRPLIVGVLPHTSCAPAVTGCGFCTFPHERFQASQVQATTRAVCREIETVQHRHPEWLGRPVDAVYLGGGTANLTPPDCLAELCGTLTRTFDLEGAEVTLEGAPMFFLSRNARLLEVLRENLPTKRLRLSMGVQTFDPLQIRSMGREAMGGRESVEKVARLAQSRGFTTSGDFLINLPGQSLSQMLDDAAVAISLGLDQICLYHLVLFAGLGTVWSRDAAKLASLPNLDEARTNWSQVRSFLLEHGYVQTSLTNFERAAVHQGQRRYVYEDCSFHPEKYDALGFGPAALGTFSDLPGRIGLKTMNEPESARYRDCAPGLAVARHFVYGEQDLKLLYLTRQISRLCVDRRSYHAAYGGDPVGDFGEEFGALLEAGLVHIGPDIIELTVNGMFYADAVAGLLASRRVRELRLGKGATDSNRADGHWMG